MKDKKTSSVMESLRLKKQEKNPNTAGAIVCPEEKSLWQKVKDSVRPFAFNIHKQDKMQRRKKSQEDQRYSFDSTAKDYVDASDMTLDAQAYETAMNFSNLLDTTLTEEGGDLSHGDTRALNKKHAQRFLRGEIEIEARLDLHRNTLEIAHPRVVSFLKSSCAKGMRCVIIVTGKGTGKMQQHVPEWLNSPTLSPYVLSFSYAQPKHGGEGALYIYLKNLEKRSY